MVRIDKTLPDTVCIVTSEIVGPHRNGGLGTATTGLAQLLASQGVSVTVVYTGDVENGTFAQWRQRYSASNINLIWLSAIQTARVVGPTTKFGWSKAWALFEYLKTAHFDVIHFNDTVGEGTFCIAAKRLGIAFQESLICLALHSPTEWILDANRSVPNWPGYCFFIAGERVSISSTDVLWSPSQYLLSWITGRDYKLPAQSFVRQYIMPAAGLFEPVASIDSNNATGLPDRVVRRSPREIVFFGRLEERKGLRLFTNVLTKLNDELTKSDVGVVFMGKVQAIDGVLADQFISSRAVNWTFKWRIESSMDQQEATSYLRENPCLAVMASPVDNSPCTVYEALQFGFPFVAARSGGIPELIHGEDRDNHLFDYSVADLSRVLLNSLSVGVAPPRPAQADVDRRQAWIDFHLNWLAHRPTRIAPGNLGRWGVVIEHSADARSLRRTFAGIRRELGADLLAAVVIRRNVVDKVDISGTPLLVVDELNEIAAHDALVWLKDQSVAGLLFLRSGSDLTLGSGQQIRRLGTQECSAIIPAIRLLDEGSVMPPVNSPELTFLGYGSEHGGFIVTQEGFDEILAHPEATESGRGFFGVIDYFHAASKEVLPMPEPLILFEDAAAILPFSLDEARQVRDLAVGSETSRYQMIGIGRHFHKNFYQPQIERRRRRRRFVEKYFPFLKRKRS